jgi:predicted Fe-S protein YdhL (DUF1289 family)
VSSVKTPCIGVCSTGIGDVVCRGCKRFAHEVIDWNGYSNEQKQLVNARIDGFLQQIVGNMLEIKDEKLLLEKIQFQQIKIEPELSSSRWLYELLRCGANQIKSTNEFGFELKPDWQRFSLEQIKQFIEQDLYTLSTAYYERYVKI